MSAPDVVYICKPDAENEELRYSLRSLKNLPHSRVFIVGGCPPWVRNVEIIPTALGRDKQVTAQRNLWVACTSPEISDPFIVFNDDFYVMQPIEELPSLNMGPMPAVIASHAPGGSYRRAMERTYDLMLELGTIDPVSFEMHIPMLIEKTGMLLALSLGKDIHGVHNRTLYGNLMGIESEESSDVKVYSRTKGRDFERETFLSTGDRSFLYHPAGRYIRERFPDPGLYEKGPIKRRSAVRYSSVVLHPK